MDKLALRYEGKDILLYRCIYAPVSSNMYILINGKEAVVIDANNDINGIKILKEKGVEILTLLLTHEHYDHTLGVRMFQEEFPNNKLICHEASAKYIASKRGNNPMLIAFVLSERDKTDVGNRYTKFKEEYKHYTLHADICLKGGEIINAAGLSFRFVHTPGHSDGSCCIEIGENYFTGDSLLKEHKTILRFPESNKDKYENITLPYLRNLDKESTIYPGHGDKFLLKESRYLWD